MSDEETGIKTYLIRVKPDRHGTPDSTNIENALREGHHKGFGDSIINVVRTMLHGKMRVVKPHEHEEIDSARSKAVSATYPLVCRAIDLIVPIVNEDVPDAQKKTDLEKVAEYLDAIEALLQQVQPR